MGGATAESFRASISLTTWPITTHAACRPLVSSPQCATALISTKIRPTRTSNVGTPGNRCGARRTLNRALLSPRTQSPRRHTDQSMNTAANRSARQCPTQLASPTVSDRRNFYEGTEIHHVDARRTKFDVFSEAPRVHGTPHQSTSEGNQGVVPLTGPHYTVQTHPDGSPFIGTFADTNHPGCPRVIRYAAYSTEVLELSGHDGEEDQPWTGSGKVTGPDTLLVDLSSKGGPAALAGKWSGTGI